MNCRRPEIQCIPVEIIKKVPTCNTQAAVAVYPRTKEEGIRKQIRSGIVSE